MRDLGKLIVAKGFKKLPEVQKIAQSGHTGGNRDSRTLQTSSWCYKTCFGGNLDLPQIEKLNKVCSDVEPAQKCENNERNVKVKLYNWFVAPKMANSCCFNLGENLNFLQKMFYNINFRLTNDLSAIHWIFFDPALNLNVDQVELANEFIFY